MITDLILSALFMPIKALIGTLPTLEIAIPSGAFNWLFDIASAIGYILPIKSLMVLLGISIAIRGFQIVWALIIRVKSFIPTMGS